MHIRRFRKLPLAPLLAVLCTLIAGDGLLPAQNAPAQRPHVFFRVRVSSSILEPISGRLLIFVRQGSGDKQVDADQFHPQAVWVAAKEVQSLAPGAVVELDADEAASPAAFATIPAGNYEAQAVLDVDHTYNYGGRGSKDWVSDVLPLGNWEAGNGDEPLLVLDHHAEEDPKRATALADLKAEAKAGIAQFEEFESPSLNRFWGHSVKIAAWVVLPPGYMEHPGTYPTAYWTHGFGGGIDSALITGMRLYERMKDGKMPPMIWVMLDESIPQGTHEFADSVNNGPWGAALTTEFIPFIEAKYHMDARPSSRLLNGHSSGGWATLQLQVNYPKIFGGTWSTSPDPSDFHAFSGLDLYAAKANAYRMLDGTAAPIFRDKGQVVATMEQYARLEEALGPYGGQLASFEWVFSPKGKDGARTDVRSKNRGS
jgi:enterochelin esterase-like enzyme